MENSDRSILNSSTTCIENSDSYMDSPPSYLSSQYILLSSLELLSSYLSSPYTLSGYLNFPLSYLSVLFTLSGYLDFYRTIWVLHLPYWTVCTFHQAIRMFCQLADTLHMSYRPYQVENMIHYLSSNYLVNFRTHYTCLKRVWDMIYRLPHKKEN